ncbi:MAG: hypothetical protein SH868_05975 [Bythopirellula sp.]|nr:hypothetical protein [Bythopirellula sp.]
MGLTRPFIESVKERAAIDPDFRGAMLAEATECFLNGEIDVAKTMLRDYVNATIGFQALGEVVDKKPQSLMRMLSKTGNPRAGNLSTLIASLKGHEGIELHVEATR